MTEQELPAREKALTIKPTSIKLKGSLLRRVEASGLGATLYVDRLYSRYRLLLDLNPVELTIDERQVLLECLNGSVVDGDFIRHLHYEVADSDAMAEGRPAAKSLLDKIQGTTLAQRLALIEAEGY